MKTSRAALVVAAALGAATGAFGQSSGEAGAAVTAPGRGVALPPGVRLLADLPYGPAARQRVDVYLPAAAPPGGAPILVMVHGGAWMFGDKTSLGVVGHKLEHWSAHGWIFVSVNNRLLPEADPLRQAEDVAHALAFVQAHAAGWGGDPGRLILMGHSAGAHLVAMLAASPARAAGFGAAPWAGTVVLDSAALDLVGLMNERHPRLYDRVFGADRAAWPAMSPTARLAADATPMLIVCSTLRVDDSCGQSERFVAHVLGAGAAARVHSEKLMHNRIDVDLGLTGPYSDDVDAFIAAAFAPRH
jgi:acetyl esterase/lipase